MEQIIENINNVSPFFENFPSHLLRRNLHLSILANKCSTMIRLDDGGYFTLF